MEITTKTLSCQLIVIILCFTAYFEAITGKQEFVFDDLVAIVKNKDVNQPHSNLSEILKHDFWGQELNGPNAKDSHKSYRPLTTLMFKFEYSFLKFNAKNMKKVNLFIHSVNTLLVWHFVKRLQIEKDTNQIATISSIIFALHPIHTEAVAGIVGRAELLFCFCFLTALLLTMIKVNNRKRQWASEEAASISLADLVVVLLTVVGVFFKETAITIPLTCVFLDYMCSGKYLKPLRKQFKKVFIARNMFYAACTLGLVAFRLWLQEFTPPEFKPMDNPVAFHENALVRVFSQNFLYVVNFWLMLCPVWLCFDWAMNCIELITSIWDLRLQAVLAFYSFVMLALINYREQYAVLVALGLLVIPFLPASGLFFKVGFVIAERTLYVPSIGFSMLVAYSYVHCLNSARKVWQKAALKWMLLVLLVCFVLRTRERTNEWRTEAQLFTSALKVCPKNAKVHYNIARLASDHSGNREMAFQHYHRAIELYPEYEAALMNLGNLYREVGNYSLAEEYIKRSVDVYPEFAAAWMNLGIVQSAQKNFASALRSYEKALQYRKNYAVCHYNMGNLFLDQKLFSEAMHHWQEAVSINPKQPKAWANILTMLDNRGLLDDALRISDQALGHLPNSVDIMFIRANILGKLKHYIEAETLYKHVIEAVPNNVLYRTNLGVLYHRWGKLESAIESYREAINIDGQKASTARENLSKLLKRIQEDVVTIPAEKS